MRTKSSLPKIVLIASIIVLVLFNTLWIYLGLFVSWPESLTLWDSVHPWFALFCLLIALYVTTLRSKETSYLPTLLLLLSLNWRVILFEDLFGTDLLELGSLLNLLFFMMFFVSIAASIFRRAQLKRKHEGQSKNSNPALLGKVLTKFSTTLVLVLVCFAIALFLCSEYFTVKLDLNQAFEVAVQAPPSKAKLEGLTVQINGVDGGKAIFGIRMPDVVKDDSGKVEFVDKESSSESLSLTPKTLDVIQTNLSQLDPQKWQVLTKLPSPIFRFDLKLISDSTSPNNSKKISYFLVTVANRGSEKVRPGQMMSLGHDLQIEEIGHTLAGAKIDLVYGMGVYMTFFDKKGRLISQATGTIIITPMVFTPLLRQFLG